MYYDNNIPEPFKRVFENRNENLLNKENSYPKLEISERNNNQKTSHPSILSIFAILHAMNII